MITRIQLLRNIGQFDSVDRGANIPLAHLTLVYAENGRGKTTLAAILRSLATADPIPISERRRLAALHQPHVVLDCSGGPPAAMFQNNAWSRTLPNIAVFDDVFVDQNVYSGLVVGPGHRQNLHELILGARGVALNRSLQQLVAEIEAHNAALRAKGAAIPIAERGGLSVDGFCALPARANIDEEIQRAERNLAAARDRNLIRNTSVFDVLTLPTFDDVGIELALDQDLPALDAATAAVQNHLNQIGHAAERWIAYGMEHHLRTQAPNQVTTCPFCAQDLAESPVIDHYRAYFSAAYAALKETLSATLAVIDRSHGGDAAAAFERAVRVTMERRQFWSRFCDVPNVALDTAAISEVWRAARDYVTASLRAKEGAPLESISMSNDARDAITAYETQRQNVATLNRQLQQANDAIRVVKEQAAAGNETALAAGVVRLKAVKARHATIIAALCNDYLAEKAAKVNTEQMRDQTKAALEQYRTNVFPGYQTAINIYLERFNSGYRLDNMSAVESRGGPTCTYNVIINNTPIAVAGGALTPGEPSFHNTLSAGDRNTLALAFFFASLDQDPGLTEKVVVIDDPISSLDEHRSLTTVQELRRLAQRASQVIVLSHNKTFLCRLWESTDRTLRCAIEIARDGEGSTLSLWNVDQDSITEHDRRHNLLRDYLANGARNREVAASVRPLLEAFLRVAWPQHFPPGTLLGPFRALCEQRLGTAQQILSGPDTQEIRDLIEYANRFHHDTNPAWETEVINDGELRGFVNRALGFARR